MQQDPPQSETPPDGSGAVEADAAPTASADREQDVRVRRNLQALLDVELPLIAVLAEKELSLAEVLGLEVDSVIVFPKHNSDPISLRVNNVEVGSGKTIKVGDHFGLHLRSYSPERVVHTLL
ncbi:MAG: FliM/FliN family flagellar motor switch protein [Planctomycetota bacterium]|jgi:flagellar motor switch/type III secretory pathway protein FliN